jgi:hypothetical protein
MAHLLEFTQLYFLFKIHVVSVYTRRIIERLQSRLRRQTNAAGNAMQCKGDASKSRRVPNANACILRN